MDKLFIKSSDGHLDKWLIISYLCTMLFRPQQNFVQSPPLGGLFGFKREILRARTTILFNYNDLQGLQRRFWEIGTMKFEGRINEK